MAQHDYTNYPSSYNVRGNLTQKTEVCLGCTSAVTAYAYDDTGQTLSMTDPRHNTTSYGYSASCDNACLTRITYPNTGVAHVENFTYNFADGQLASSQDGNGRTTSYFYGENGDELDRLTGINYPDCVAAGACTGSTHSISNTYNDAGPNPSITTTKLLSASGTPGPYVSTSVMDCLGRVLHVNVTSDPHYTDSTYDGLGQVLSVSNPYRSTSDSTYGITTSARDGLGRVTSLTRPDNSTVRTAYAGNCVTVTDEAGNPRTSCSDALGRITSVSDASGATSYGYNALDDLTDVYQGSQHRQFGYDSLSRLSSATNPEPGTTSFTYDANGNVLTRTDARNVKTTYAYDSLNRLTSKSYNDTPQTPTANFYYDETSVTIGSWTSPTLTNTKGRLPHTTAMSGSTLLAETVNSYDAMGRPAAYYQCTPQTCPGSTAVTSTYGYDLAGDLTSQLLPAVSPLSITITNTVNSAQQITQMTSSYVGSTYPATVGSFSYAPFGALSTITDGCVGSGCTPNVETYTYNNRLQPVMIQVGRQGGSLSAYSCTVYNYYSTNPTSCATPSQGSSGNNGNVMGYYFQDSANSSLGHTAAYGYDSLNRLTSAQATGSSTYSLGFGYDQYGNVTCTGGAGGGSANGPCASVGYNTATNRISTIAGSSTGISYDAAGELLQDGTGTGAHAYTWDAEGRLTSVASPPGTTIASYVYNALGQRVEKSGSGTGGWAPFDQLYDAFGSYVTLIEGSNANEKTYLPPVAGRLFGEYAGNATAYLHANVLGSTGTIIDAANNVLADEIYDPWGQRWASYGNLSYNESYAAMGQRDWESGLDPTPNRTFTSQYGRWLSPDPAGGHIEDPQTLNKYAYVRNNPTTLTDSSGLDFYLQCADGKNHEGCTQVDIGNSKGVWVQADKNGNATIITSDSIREGKNTAAVDENGVQINGKNEGIYFDNPASHTSDANGNDVNRNPIDLTGTGAGLGGFVFHVDRSDPRNGVLAGGTFSFSGTDDEMREVLLQYGFNYGFGYENAFGNPHHPGMLNFRFSEDPIEAQLGMNAGPSLHMTMPKDPKLTVPREFHVDSMTGFAHRQCANGTGACL